MARVMGLSGYGCQLNRSMQHFNQVIRQYFPPKTTDLSGCTQSNPRQGGVPLNRRSRTTLRG
jgi:IS30 family transposase